MDFIANKKTGTKKNILNPPLACIYIQYIQMVCMHSNSMIEIKMD